MISIPKRVAYLRLLGFIWLIGGVLAWLSPPAVANPLESVPIHRGSPAEVFQSFITATARLEADYAQYIQDKSPARVAALTVDLRRIRGLLDLSQVPPATRVRVGNAAITYLYDILARMPAVRWDTIPGYSAEGEPIDNRSLPDRWTLPGTDIQIVRIADGPAAGDYQFSADSVAHLSEYYHQIADLPLLHPRIFPSFYLEQSNATGPWISDKWVQRIPDWLQVHHFNTPSWKIVLIVSLNIISVCLFLLWARFAWRGKHHVPETNLAHLAWSLSVPVLGWLLLYGGDYFITAQVNPVGSFANNEGLLVSALYYGLYAWLAWLAVYFLAEGLIRYADQKSKDYDEPLIRLLAKLIALVAVASILVAGADELGIPALGLVAGFGVGGIAVALASQSTIENLFGGLSLFADRPFRVGEKILFNNQSANVLRVGPRSTRLRTRDGALWTVPNADLAKMHIANYSLRSGCYMDQVVALDQNSSVVHIEQLLAQVRERLVAEELVEVKEGWPRVQLVGVEPGRINIRLRATFLTTEYSVFLERQQLIMLYVLKTAHELGLKLACPLPEVSKHR